MDIPVVSGPDLLRSDAEARLADVFRNISFVPGESYGPHSHIRIEINYVTTGSCQLYLDGGGRSLTFRKGDTMVISPGTVHRFQAGRKGASLLQLEMRPDVLDRVVSVGLSQQIEFRFLPERPVMRISGDARVRSTIHAIVWELNNRRSGYQSAALINYAQLMILFGRHFGGADEPKTLPASLAKAVTAIRRDAFGRLDFDAVAAEAGITDRQLRKLFSTHMGCTPSDFLLRLRIDHAVALLTFGDHSVKEVCFACGFSSPQYFSRVFRKATGNSPGALLGRKMQV